MVKIEKIGNMRSLSGWQMDLPNEADLLTVRSLSIAFGPVESIGAILSSEMVPKTPVIPFIRPACAATLMEGETFSHPIPDWDRYGRITAEGILNLRAFVFATGALGLAAVAAIAWRVRLSLAETTLNSAWRWFFGGVIAWCAAWTCTYVPALSERGIADQLWYGVALLTLCSPIAVLGAKLPMTRVWGWFILAPLLLVLGWPALYAWRGGWPPMRLVIQEPAVVAYGFVCLMGFGNYFGTRFAPSAFLIAGALLAIVAPLSLPRAESSTTVDALRTVATFSLIAAVFGPILSRRIAPRPVVRNGIDYVWRDFRDYYGIVWGRRIQDRFNLSAQQRGSDFRLAPGGLRRTEQTPKPGGNDAVDPDELQASEGTLRWLLRRFVGPQWIDARMGESTTQSAAPQPPRESIISKA